MILIRAFSGHCETSLKFIGSSNGVTGRADLPDRLRVPDCLRHGGALPRRLPPAQGDLALYPAKPSLHCAGQVPLHLRQGQVLRYSHRDIICRWVSGNKLSPPEIACPQISLKTWF